MKNQFKSSEEAGTLLSSNDKKEMVSEYFHQLLDEAFDEIDEGTFNETFCPCCVLEYVLEQDRERRLPDVSFVESKLPKEGKHKTYEIVGYLDDGHLMDSFAPIGSFDAAHLVGDILFEKPINGKFNIHYPFQDVLFECTVTNAGSVGEILSKISAAYEFIYKWADENYIEYIHEIGDLVFEDCIRIYENGTIEFRYGS